MNVHADLLAELQKYKGGEFVPRWMNSPLKHVEAAVFQFGNYGIMGPRDAHAHIELAAWRAVRDSSHVLVQPFGLSSNPRTSSWGLYRLGVNSLQFVTNPCGCMTNPDDAAALLAALRHINGATK